MVKKRDVKFLLGYRMPGVELYKPKVNRWKQVFLLLAFIPFFVTVGTNWLYFVGLKALFKYDLLWLYR